MKKILYILAAAAVLFSCAKEEFQHPSEKNIPEAASYQPVITVDQETNQVTFSLDATAVIPVWVFQNSEGAWAETHTGNGYKKIFASAGDYSVRMQVMNASGVSPDYVEKSFHVDNTLVNFDKYITILSKGPWHIDGLTEAHMACGESVENPSGWWGAPKNDKAAFGVYDNRLSFSTDGKYTFDPGEPGTVYVNIGVTVSPFADAKGDATADFQAPAQQQTTEYGFDVEGDNLYLALEPGALFPYIPNDDFVTDTRFLITAFAAKSITLVWFTPTGNNGGPIAWQFILTNVEGGDEPIDNPGGGEVVFDYNSDRNLWKAADAAHTYSQYYAPGWAQLANPEITNSGNVYSFSCPTATSDQWQNQFFIIPDAPIALSKDKTYDFQCKVTLSQDVNQVTFKLTDAASDNNFLFTERHDITAYEEFTLTITGVTGIDAEAVKMVFDFGGNPDNTEVEIKEIILQEHEGEVSGGGSGTSFDYNSSRNLWKAADAAHTYSQYYAPGWAQLANPEITNSGNVYSFSCPTATSDQWQNQFFIIPDAPIALSKDKTYDFQCKVTLSQDVKQVTFKLTDTASDNNFLFTERRDIAAYEEFTLTLVGVTGIDAEAVKMVFDFGGNPDNTEVEIKEIILQEHEGEVSGGGNESSPFDYNSADNLWKAADAAHTYSQYYAPGWAQLANPEITNSGNVYSFSCPSATSDQWQNQFFIIPDAPIALSAEKTYDFQCKVELSQDVKQVTFKLTDTASDNNFLFTERRDIAAYDEFTFTLVGATGIDAAAVKLVFDFGGNPDNTDVTISEIILREHK